MFARFAAIALALPLLAAAQNCNTGPIQCCNSVESSSSDAGTALLSLLGVAVGNIVGQIGLQCSPLSVVGVGSEACGAHPVCCQNNNVGGLISVGCIPVEL
ncbi:Fruiting body protein SC1 [Trametes pubescens]|uniref:Hydrophobin n=1 Tax=Trametes pubescens TaxID=154538 RepID=A0A1M2W2T6_TRAPU|nr:Fruiting body protein SC1 [Trametes pubescens]